MFYKLLWCWMINYFFPPFSDKEMRWHLNLGTVKAPRGITACYCGSWPCVAGGGGVDVSTKKIASILEFYESAS